MVGPNFDEGLLTIEIIFWTPTFLDMFPNILKYFWMCLCSTTTSGVEQAKTKGYLYVCLCWVFAITSFYKPLYSINILTILQCFVRNFFIAIKELQPAPGFKEFQRRPPDFRLFFRNSSNFTFTWSSNLPHFLQLLISQARDNIFKVFKSIELSTHRVLLNCASGTLQCTEG